MSSQRKELTIGTFNVRGLAKEEKQELLAQDIDNYKINVCCLQETKIKDGRDITIGEKQHKLIALPSDNRHYGNGFTISNSLKNNIHRHWKVSDRISVLELAQDRDAWKKFVNDIYKVAEDEKSHSYQCAIESKQL